MRRTRALTVFAAPALAATLLLAGCSDDDDPAPGAETSAPATSGTPTESETTAGTDFAALDDEALIARVQEAAADIRTVHVNAELTTDDGQHLVFDMDADNTTGQYHGTVTVDGLEAEILRTEDAVYTKAGTEFWLMDTGDRDLAEQFAGKYVRFDESDPRTKSYDEFARFGDVSALLKEWPAGFTRADEELDGKPVLVTTNENRSNDGQTIVYLPKEGEPIPLRMRNTNPESPGQFDWSKVNEPVEFPEPPASEIIDVPRKSSSPDAS